MKPLKKKVTHKELIDKKHGKEYKTILKNIKERRKKRK